MKTINEICIELADAIKPIILSMSHEEQCGIPVALASLTGNAAKLSKIYTEKSLKKMIDVVILEGFNLNV